MNTMHPHTSHLPVGPFCLYPRMRGVYCVCVCEGGGGVMSYDAVRGMQSLCVCVVRVGAND